MTVLWEKWIEFKRDFVKITLAAMITPLMYLIVFGLGVKAVTDNGPYINFLIPGIVAISTMTGSFGSVAQNMCVQRIYERALDQVMISPTPLWQFILGQIIGGSLRGMYSAVVILIMVLPLRTGLHFGIYSFGVMFINGVVFSTIALVLSFMAKSYSDAPKYNTYIIMPMSFLCNTFFSVDTMPEGFRQVVGILPLSKASLMLRQLSVGIMPQTGDVLVLLFYIMIFTGIAVGFIYKKKNM